MSTAERKSGAAAVSALNHLRAILLLPFMNTIVIPGLILFFAGDYRVANTVPSLTVATFGLLLVAAGFALVVRSIALFVRLGRGTLAPWDPTRVLITAGVYRLSRNPMKSGLFLVLLGESLISGSRGIALWTACFIIANVLYIRGFEEPGLRRRFGAAYLAYCERVPRWLGLGGLRRANQTAESAP